MRSMLQQVSGAIAGFLLIGLVSTGVLGLATPTALAATSPAMGAASPFGVAAGTFSNSNTAPQTIIEGSVCATTHDVPGPLSVTGETLTPCPPSVADAQTAAIANVNAQALLPGCISLGASVNLNAVDLDGAGVLPPGTFVPGCYSTTGDMTMDISSSITLDGAGTYIFKPGGELSTGDDSFVTLAGGASACDIFWAPTGGTTLGAYTGALPNPTSFAGTIFRGDGAGLSITLGHFSNLIGRAMAFGSTVTTDANTITVPTECSAAPPSGGTGGFTGTINVVKTVINDNGGTATVSTFPLFLNGSPIVSGITNPFSFQSGTSFTVTETGSAQYARTFSGDCDANGNMFLDPAENLFCVITNDDIGAPVVVPPVPPLIDVVKVPSPLALPDGPGLVTYTYTVRNIGTVPMTNVTMVGDTCSPIVRVSGDTDGDNVLDLTEVWVHTCTTFLPETHTNTVVATGWANGLSSVDIASATVVVGIPVVPPLVHLTKVPSVFTLLAGGGLVTYTQTVTNPGTVPLSNVLLTDPQCGPMQFRSGDVDGDALLDTNESWTYTCQATLTRSTTNTASVTAEANGFLVRDLAIAPVIVAAAVPALPNTGAGPTANLAIWSVVAASILAVVYAVRKALIV